MVEGKHANVNQPPEGGYSSRPPYPPLPYGAEEYRREIDRVTRKRHVIIGIVVALIVIVALFAVAFFVLGFRFPFL